MKKSEILETIAILVAVLSLMPVAYWWHMGDLSQHRLFLYYLFAMLCILVYVTYRRVKRLRAALKSSKKDGSGPPVPPFFK
jgi:uncharacterized membrane protein